MRPLARAGAIPCTSYEDFCSKLRKPRTVILMVTAGKAVDEVIAGLTPFLAQGDTVIDAGNSLYTDSVRRHKQLAKEKISFLDAGTSGGLNGARHGACITVGGDEKAFKRSQAILKKISAPGGLAYAGPSGAGHFVKMVHN